MTPASPPVIRRRPLLLVALTAIGITAALGLYAVAVPHFGDFQAKVLATSASVSGACVLTLTCLPAWERRQLRAVALLGMAASLLGFALLIAGIWSEPDADSYWKTTVTVLLLALWSAISSLLALATLAPRYRWTFWAAVGVLLVFAGLGAGAMWGEPSSAAYGRVVGAFGVLTAAFVLSVPILHRASRGESAAAPAGGSVAFCPSCGQAVQGREGAEISCAHCRARFRVGYQ